MQLNGGRIRLGVHCGQQFDDFEEYLALWRRFEDLGFDWVSCFDHYRPPDRPDGPCFEGPTLLAALAARTSRVRCAILVTSVTNRHPAALATIASTIDHVSSGRLELGVGAGGPDLAHTEYGLPFPGAGTRLEMLDEACSILRSLWTEESTTFHGKHFHLDDARLPAKPLQARLPLVVAGADERRTLRIAARHADVWSTFGGDLGLYEHQLGVLAGHCREIARDPAEIRKSLLFRALVSHDGDDAVRRRDEMLGDAPPDSIARRMSIAGTPEQCVETLSAYVDVGVRDFLFGVRAPVDWETLELLASAVGPALRAERV